MRSYYWDSYCLFFPLALHYTYIFILLSIYKKKKKVMHTYSGLNTQSMIINFWIKMNYFEGKMYQGDTTVMIL